MRRACPRSGERRTGDESPAVSHRVNASARVAFVHSIVGVCWQAWIVLEDAELSLRSRGAMDTQMSVERTYLPSMEPERVAAAKIRRRVRESSISQYAVARDLLKVEREAEALRRVAAFWNRWQRSPTVGELAAKMLRDNRCAVNPQSWMFAGARLWLARGISGLQSDGLIEPVPQGNRRCHQTGVTCTTWRVTLAGRNKLQPARR